MELTNRGAQTRDLKPGLLPPLNMKEMENRRVGGRLHTTITTHREILDGL